MPAEASIRDRASHPPGVVEELEVVEGPEVSAQDAEGEHARERGEAHRDPEPGAQPVFWVHVSHDGSVRARVVGHAFLLECQGRRSPKEWGARHPCGTPNGLIPPRIGLLIREA